MKRPFLVRSALTVLFVCASPALVCAGGQGPKKHVSERTTLTLKKYMANFGSMLAGLEIMRIKDKTIDWEAIDLTIREMTQTLQDMQAADRRDAYKAYTDLLDSGLVEIREKSQKRDKKIFKSVDKLSVTCFKCHTAHRPGDYILPKNEKIGRRDL